MASRRLRIGRISNIEIRLDYSWFIVFVLIVWSLANHYFPRAHPGYSTSAYWAIASITALFFFGSVLAHELAHSLVSQAHGIAVRDITLFIFGGVAQISEEPKSARGELLMALAGPVASLGIAGLFGALWLVLLPVSPQFHALAGWLASINAGLGLFNLIPGFPLDGGRVLRALVWGATGNLRRATEIAARVGQVVAAALVLWGIWQIFRGNWANGVWIAFIGWFLESAATASHERVTLLELLAGHSVREVMMTDCPRIAGDLPLDVVVERAVIPSGRRCFPVAEDDHVLGLLTLHNIKRVPRERWARTRVDEAMIPRKELRTVAPGDDLAAVFERMASEDINQFPVTENGSILGMVDRNSLLAFLHMRAELGV